MKNLFIVPLLIVSFFISCTDDDFVGSSNLISEIRDVDSFTKIKSEGVFDITIVQGSEQFLEITANENIIHRVKTEVSNDELYLHMEDGDYKGLRLKANITVTALNRLSNAGTGDIVASNIDNSNSLEVENTGTGDITLIGTAQELELNNEGVGEIQAFELISRDCKVTTVGTGDCEVHCNDNLDVRIIGSGDVYYMGEPTINVEVTGSGSLIHEG